MTERREARRARRETEHAAELQAWVEREVAKAPPLTHEQVSRLAVLLRP